MLIHRKIKILFLIPSLRIAGAEKICSSICDNLNYSEYDVYLISLSNEIPLFNTINNKYDINLFTCDEPKNLKFPWLSIKALYKFYKYIKEIKPDIVHSHLWGNHSIYLYMFLLIKNRSKFIATIHNSEFHYTSPKLVMKYFLIMENTIYRLLKFNIVSISENVNEMVRKKLYYHSLTRIDNGIDIKKFYPSEIIRNKTRKSLEIENKYPILIHIGRASEVKRQIDIIYAVSFLKDKYEDVILLLVGRDNKEEYGPLVNKLNLSNHVLFLGVSENVMEIINCADIGIFPSLYEGLSLALAEQMSCGLPMIVSNIASLKEIADDGDSALLVPIKDPRAISDAVIKLINNPELLNKLKDVGRKSVIKKYSLVNMVNAYVSLYNKVLLIF